MRLDPVMSLSRPALLSCASCAGQTDANMRCAGCPTFFYCSRACQKADWRLGGHKRACKGLARGHRDREAQSRALARIALMSGGAPDDAHCMFCLGGSDATDPILRGCACRGSSGWSHAGCLIRVAEAAPAMPPGEPTFTSWQSCSTCKQDFTGLVQLRLAIALWAKYEHLAETGCMRLAAASAYALALETAGEHAEAARLQRGLLDVRTRTSGPEHHNTLTCASNLASALLQLGEHAEAAEILRSTLAIETRTLGADDLGTLTTSSSLVTALFNLGEYAEAEVLGRRTLENMRRVFGRDHFETLIASGKLAASLLEQGKHAEAVEINREVLVSMTRLLGAEHHIALYSATNLAASLSWCGLHAEAEQILRDTLPLDRRTLGPTHELTQKILQNLR